MMPAAGVRNRSKTSITPERAQGELALRKLAQRDLIHFSQYVDASFQRYEHQVYLAGKLMQVKRYIETRGQEGINRLMILMPPRHGKTELSSIKFPAWVLGSLPDTRVILTSYASDLASRNSRMMRDLVNSNRYQAVFGINSSEEEPVMLSADSRSATSWDLARPHRGGVLAAGVGGGITGHGADLLIIDDPFKNREEAESEPRRELVDDWTKSSVMTRLSPFGAIILFHTRWHPDDQAGRFIKRMVENERADQWDIVCLPALALGDYPDEEKQRTMMRDGVYLPTEDPLGRESGSALMPDKYPKEWLDKQQSNVGSYDFEALYQQMPYLRSGELFKREYFTIVDLPPKPEDVVMRLRYWDKAGTKTGTGGDWNVGVRMCITKQEMLYVEHVARFQGTPMQREERIVEVAKTDAELSGPRTKIFHQQDPGSAGLDSAQATNRRLAKEGFKANFETVTGDKEVRAGPWSTACQGGQVYLLRGAWNEKYIDEHVSFPKGKYDDQVDTSSGGYTKLIGKVKRESRIL